MLNLDHKLTSAVSEDFVKDSMEMATDLSVYLAISRGVFIPVRDVFPDFAGASVRTLVGASMRDLVWLSVGTFTWDSLSPHIRMIDL